MGLYGSIRGDSGHFGVPPASPSPDGLMLIELIPL